MVASVSVSNSSNPKSSFKAAMIHQSQHEYAGNRYKPARREKSSSSVVLGGNGGAPPEDH